MNREARERPQVGQIYLEVYRSHGEMIQTKRAIKITDVDQYWIEADVVTDSSGSFFPKRTRTNMKLSNLRKNYILELEQ